MTENAQETQETLARRIIERLKMFNRKERDHLMKFALCENPGTPRISNALWEMISNGGTRPNPDAMFVGMDYHLNWLYAALRTAGNAELESGRGSPEEFANAWKCELPPDIRENNLKPIQDNQEDVDLLIAWFDQRWAVPLRLILVEAKLDSSWGSKQFRSKKERLTLIREDANSRSLDFIDWQFLLLSPNEKSPSRNEFQPKHFEGRYKWLLKDKGQTGNDQLWHETWALGETLPIQELRRVARVSKDHGKWVTTPSHKRSDLKSDRDSA